MKRFCEFCGEKSLSLELHTEHTLGCKENPRNKPKPKSKKPKSQVLSELVSDNAKTLDDIPRLVSEVMLKEGYEVVFQSIPSRWSDKPYSNPYGVRFPNDEKIYAGWTGQWKGTITPLKVNTRKRPEITISDLSSTWSDGAFGFKFIRTESGSSGKDFNISGHILVDDFPHLHNKFYTQGYNKRYTKVLNEKVLEIQKEVKKERHRFVDEDKDMIVIRAELAKINTMYQYINELGIKKQNDLNTYFDRNKSIKLPVLENPFVDMSEYTQLVFKYQDKTDFIMSEELSALTAELEDKVDKAVAVANDNLERFI